MAAPLPVIPPAPAIGNPILAALMPPVPIAIHLIDAIDIMNWSTFSFNVDICYTTMPPTATIFERRETRSFLEELKHLRGD